jgi:hypothetical protein
MRILKLAFTTSLILVLSACATPYQPKGFTGGYSDARLDENTVRVSFLGNGNTDKDTVETSSLYRCAEVTLQDGFDYFIIASGGTTRDSNTVTTADSYHEYKTKKVKLKGNRRVYSEDINGYYQPGETFNVVNYSSNVTIKMYKGKKPANNPNAYDAHSIIRYLTPAIKP